MTKDELKARFKTVMKGVKLTKAQITAIKFIVANAPDLLDVLLDKLPPFDHAKYSQLCDEYPVKINMSADKTKKLFRKYQHLFEDIIYKLRSQKRDYAKAKANGVFVKSFPALDVYLRHKKWDDSFQGEQHEARACKVSTAYERDRSVIKKDEERQLRAGPEIVAKLDLDFFNKTRKSSET